MGKLTAKNYGYLKGFLLNSSLEKFKQQLNKLENNKDIDKGTYNQLNAFIENVSSEHDKCYKEFAEYKKISRNDSLYRFMSEIKILFNPKREDLKKKIEEIRKENKQNKENQKTKFEDCIEGTNNFAETYSEYKNVYKSFKKVNKGYEIYSRIQEALRALDCKIKEAGEHGEIMLDIDYASSELRQNFSLLRDLQDLLKEKQYIELEGTDLLSYKFFDKDNEKKIKVYLEKLEQAILCEARNEKMPNIKDEHASDQDVRKLEPERKNKRNCLKYLKKYYGYLPISVIEGYYNYKEGIKYIVGSKSNKKIRKTAKRKNKKSLEEMLKRECREDSFIFGDNSNPTLDFYVKLLSLYEIDKSDIDIFKEYTDPLKTYKERIPQEEKDEIEHKREIYTKFQENFIIPQVLKLYPQILDRYNIYIKDLSDNNKIINEIKRRLPNIINGIGNGEYIYDRLKLFNKETINFINEAHNQFYDPKLRTEIGEYLKRKITNIPHYMDINEERFQDCDSLDISLTEFGKDDLNWRYAILVEILKNSVGEYPPKIQGIMNKYNKRNNFIDKVESPLPHVTEGEGKGKDNVGQESGVKNLGE